jgi:hypothetical protein
MSPRWAPNAEITVFPWEEPEELKQRTIEAPLPPGAHPDARRRANSVRVG